MSTPFFTEEDELIQAVENGKRQLLRKFNTKTPQYKEAWEKMVLNFRKTMIAALRQPDVPQVIEFMVDPWMLHHLPSPSECLPRLLKDSFLSDDTSGFSVSSAQHNCYINADALKLLPIVENYANETSRKRQRSEHDLESGLMVVDERASQTSAPTAEEINERTLVLIREFIAEQTRKTEVPEKGIEEFILFSFWCTWLYEKEKSGKLPPNLYVEPKLRPGRRRFPELFLQESGFSKKKVSTLGIIEGIQVKGAGQSPWWPAKG